MYACNLIEYHKCLHFNICTTHTIRNYAFVSLLVLVQEPGIDENLLAITWSFDEAGAQNSMYEPRTPAACIPSAQQLYDQKRGLGGQTAIQHDHQLTKFNSIHSIVLLHFRSLLPFSQKGTTPTVKYLVRGNPFWHSLVDR